MFQIFRRIGLFRRRWVWVLLLLGGVLAAGWYIVPWSGLGAELRLVALRPDGSFTQTVSAGITEPVDADSGAVAAPQGRPGAVPLVLAVANAGTGSGRPERLVLAMPRWYRLVEPGPNVRQEQVPGEPLHRYVIDGDFPTIQHGRVPTLLPGVDTLWLEPFVPDYYCTSDSDSVPQLIPSARPDSAGILPVRIFYSFEGAELRRRQTGLLTVQVEGGAFSRSGPADDPSAAPVQLQLPEAPRPEMGALVDGGSRTAECGPPGDPMTVYSRLWLTADSGRMISVHFGGQPRKEFYDLDRDSVIELEMWDPDGDGRMEAWRRLRLPIPEYLLPEPPPAPVIAAVDSLATDSLATDSIRGDSAGVTAPTRGVVAVDLVELGRSLIPGEMAGARRLFAPRPAPAPRPDGPLGTPLGEPAPQPAPARDEPQQAAPDEPGAEPEPETPPPARPDDDDPPASAPIGAPVG